MKEQLTHDEIGVLATSLNLKIRELEKAVAVLAETEGSKYLTEYKTELANVKKLQDKLYQIYSS